MTLSITWRSSNKNKMWRLWQPMTSSRVVMKSGSKSLTKFRLTAWCAFLASQSSQMRSSWLTWRHWWQTLDLLLPGLSFRTKIFLAVSTLKKTNKRSVLPKKSGTPKIGSLKQTKESRWFLRWSIASLNWQEKLLRSWMQWHLKAWKKEWTRRSTRWPQQ